MIKDKHYWSIYYGVDENLSDKEFWEAIKKINQEAEEFLKEMNSKKET